MLANVESGSGKGRFASNASFELSGRTFGKRSKLKSKIKERTCKNDVVISRNLFCVY